MPRVQHIDVEDPLMLPAVGHPDFVVNLSYSFGYGVRPLPFRQQLVGTGWQKDKYLVTW
jgi:hypothetical protein